jgi:hypothetical protein
VSNLIFPSSLPGFGLKITREPYTNVQVQRAVSGRETRYTWMSAPLYRYHLQLDFARTAATYKELQALAGFFVRHFGQLDSFLFTDPEDCTVTDHGFGVGNGATAVFQLQRTLGGPVYDTLGGPWATSSKPRTNLIKHSETLEDAYWARTGVNPALGVAALSPRGDMTARVFTPSGGAPLPNIAAIEPGIVAGKTYTASFWLKLITGATGPLRAQMFGTSGAYLDCAVASAWQRFSFSSAYAAPLPSLSFGNNSSWGARSIAIWGVQLEEGTEPSQYIPTTTTQIMRIPYYWPSYVDGFEPVTDLAPGLSIYVDGVLKTLTTDYTVSATGLVTFAAPPAEGAVLTWSGGYYRRVRFASEGLSAERLVLQLWRLGAIELQSVKV